MTTETANKIDAAIDRLVREMGSSDYDLLLRSIPPVILYRLLCQLGLQEHFPQLESYEMFSENLNQMQTREGIRELMIAREEPNPESLKEGLTRLKLLPSMVKRALAGAAAQIRPSGGPTEKLADPKDILKLVDEIFDAQKRGESLESVQSRIAKRKDVSLKTVQRRFREEMKRRQALHGGGSQTTPENSN